ncbi:hypothetical protein [Brevundimonas sp.]
MTVHVFPSGRVVPDAGKVGREAARDRATRLEDWLTAGLIVATAVQAGLFAWFWLG